MIEVLVIACRDGSRPVAHERTRASLEASDVGGGYRWLAQPLSIEAWTHWLWCVEQAQASAADLVVVLEDDVLVNRHLLHNVQSWGDVQRGYCAAGWAFNLGGYAQEGPRWFDERALNRPLCCTQGVVYRPHLLRKMGFADRCAKLHHRLPDQPWDWIAGRVLTSAAWRVSVHHPSLVEHQWDVPSVVGNVPTSEAELLLRTSNGTFMEGWKR